MHEYILDLLGCRSLVINYLERTFIDDDDVGIAFIYFKYKENQSIENLLGCLLQQLAQRRSDVSDNIRNLYNNHIKKNTRPSLSEYSKLLKTEAYSLSRVFIVIDALDECIEADESRHTWLGDPQKLSNARLCLTCRQHIVD